jgi:hypothetical protein
MTTTANSSYANFNGGSVTISGIQGDTGYGIYAFDSAFRPCYIHYSNSLASNSITINSNATGASNYGIFTNDTVSHLQIAGADITNGSDLDSFSNFVSSTSANGNAVSWTGSTNITHSW